jgi:hypothetical protein
MADATIQNDPSKRGQLAAKKELFGPYSRYAIAPVHTRFDAVEWFVWDAFTREREDSTLPAVIRQEPTKEAALAGLDMSDPFDDEGTEGQDRDGYTDTQDRDTYSVETSE